MSALKSYVWAAQWRLRCALRHPEDHPIFVLGNQKSGTSAIAGLLAYATDQSAAIDLKYEMRFPSFDRVYANPQKFAHLIRNNTVDFSKRIIKEPHLTVLYASLKRTFPESRFVFIIRNPYDNIRSILNRLSTSGDLSTLSDKNIMALSRSWRLVMDGRWLGIHDDHYIGQLAKRWNVIADVYLNASDKFTLMPYERFIKNKLGAIAELASSLDLPIRRDISGRLDYQYQPPGSRNVNLKDFFGNNLKLINEYCAERMHAFNYMPI